MSLSAELRWFWRGLSAPRALDAWFKSGDRAPGGGQRLRSDVYFYEEPSRDEEDTSSLQLKERGGRPGIEVKGFVCDLAPVAPFDKATPQLWRSWSTAKLALSGGQAIKLQKLRWVRKFDTTGSDLREVPLNGEEKPIPPERMPAEGCNVELTQVFLESGEVWWSFCLEAFASQQEKAAQALARTAKHITAAASLIGGGELLSYPAFIAKHAVA
jgi:hypothetical protein